MIDRTGADEGAQQTFDTPAAPPPGRRARTATAQQLDLLGALEPQQRARGPVERPNLAKRLRAFAYRFTLWEVWSDFIALSALSLVNGVDRRPAQWRAREDEYLQITRKYAPEELQLFTQAFADLVLLLEEEPRDVLGATFMDLDLGNKWSGQFFTPMHVCDLMAGITLTDLPDVIARQGFITVCEPAVGGGAMVIALYRQMCKQGFNPQRQVHVTATDVDIRAVHMAYIQFSLLHIPAIVVHGNSLSLEQHSVWPTPAHVLDFWGPKLARRAQASNSAVEGAGAVGEPV
ncbi:MAG TPA: N-6 DNA methylase [Nevskia sp.]|nr:N-6 DNA methylase [Nevskia sp.]